MPNTTDISDSSCRQVEDAVCSMVLCRSVKRLACVSLICTLAMQMGSLCLSAQSVVSASETPSSDAAVTPARSLPSLLPLITEEAMAGVVIFPRQFFTSDAVRHLPIEIVTTDLERCLGVDLREIEFVVGFLERAPTNPVSIGFIVQFSEPFDWAPNSCWHAERNGVWHAGRPALSQREGGTRYKFDAHGAEQPNDDSGP